MANAWGGLLAAVVSACLMVLAILGTMKLITMWF